MACGEAEGGPHCGRWSAPGSPVALEIIRVLYDFRSPLSRDPIGAEFMNSTYHIVAHRPPPPAPPLPSVVRFEAVARNAFFSKEKRISSLGTNVSFSAPPLHPSPLRWTTYETKRKRANAGTAIETRRMFTRGT